MDLFDNVDSGFDGGCWWWCPRCGSIWVPWLYFRMVGLWAGCGMCGWRVRPPDGSCLHATPKVKANFNRAVVLDPVVKQCAGCQFNIVEEESDWYWWHVFFLAYVEFDVVD